jgi:hypothetical protein
MLTIVGLRAYPAKLPLQRLARCDVPFEGLFFSFVPFRLNKVYSKSIWLKLSMHFGCAEGFAEAQLLVSR